LRKGINLFFFFFLFACSLCAQQIPQNGLVAWYPFCGNANDYSGNAYNLTVSNATLTTDRFGNHNSAYLFNGNNSQIFRQGIFNLTGDFTMACWALADTDLNAIIVYNGFSGSNGFGIIESDAPVYSIGHNFTVLYGGVNHMATYTITKHLWHQAVFRKSGSSYNLIIDTVVVSTFSAGFLTPCCKFTLGADTSGGHAFKGKIDDVAIYNRAITDSEVKILYHYGGTLLSNVSSNSPICNGDTLKLYSTTSLSGTTLNWSGPASFSATVNNPILANATSANSGNYIVKDSFQYGCFVIDTINVAVNTVPSHSISSNSPVCAGDTIKLYNTATNLHAQHWSGPAGFTSSASSPIIPNATAADSGMYYVLDSFQNGCRITDSVWLTIKPKPAIPNLSSNAPICAPDSLKLFATDSTPGVSFSWSGPASFSSALQNPFIVNTTVSNSGIYTATVTLNACTNSATINAIVNPGAVNATLSISASPSNIICTGNSITFTANAGNTPTPGYQWRLNGTNIPGANNTTYTSNTLSTGDVITCFVQSASPCMLIDSALSNAITIAVNITPAHAISSNSPICAGDTLKLFNQLSNFNSIHWSGPASFSSAQQNPIILNTSSLSGGTYYVTDTFTNGCVATDSLQVYVNAMPAHAISANSPLCAGDTLQLNNTITTSGALYYWYGPASFMAHQQNVVINGISAAQAGAYYAIDSFNNGCVGRDTVVVVVKAIPAHTLTVNSPLCVGDTITFNMATVGLSFLWSGPNAFSSTLQNPKISPALLSDSGRYFVHEVFPNACKAIDSIWVTIHQTPPAPQITSNSPLCEGANLLLQATDSLSTVTFSWTGPAGYSSTQQNVQIQQVSIANAGTYEVSAILGNCKSISTTQVVVYPNVAPQFTFSGIPCIHNNITVQATNATLAPNNYLWNFGNTTVISGAGAGPYQINCTDSGLYLISLSIIGNCFPPDTQQFTVYAPPTDSIWVANHEVCFGDTITLKPSVLYTAATYYWEAGPHIIITDTQKNSCTAVIDNNGKIYLQLSDVHHCTTTDSIAIQATPCCYYYIPNAFTPNNDKLNDVYKIRAPKPLQDYDFSIYNRWGQQVFSSKDMNEGWDGKFNGTDQEVGTYFYLLKYTCGTNKEIRKGDLTLIR